jgi:hypothetical protein
MLRIANNTAASQPAYIATGYGELPPPKHHTNNSDTPLNPLKICRKSLGDKGIKLKDIFTRWLRVKSKPLTLNLESATGPVRPEVSTQTRRKTPVKLVKTRRKSLSDNRLFLQGAILRKSDE